MPQLVGVPGLEREVRIKFDNGFTRDSFAHHVTRRDVERVLRWPRWVDELTAGAEVPPAESVTAWVAKPPMPDARDPSVLLVVTRDRKHDRRVHDAWRLYLSDIDLSRARSGYDVLTAFLDRYGLDVQLGSATRRLFLPCRVPMAARGNASAHVIGNAPSDRVRVLDVFRLVPERIEIDVGVAFAVNESALCADLARHGTPPILRAFS